MSVASESGEELSPDSVVSVVDLSCGDDELKEEEIDCFDREFTSINPQVEILDDDEHSCQFTLESTKKHDHYEHYAFGKKLVFEGKHDWYLKSFYKIGIVKHCFINPDNVENETESNNNENDNSTNMKSILNDLDDTWNYHYKSIMYFLRKDGRKLKTNLLSVNKDNYVHSCDERGITALQKTFEYCEDTPFRHEMNITGVHLDIDNGTISFSINGKNFGIAYDNILNDHIDNDDNYNNNNYLCLFRLCVEPDTKFERVKGRFSYVDAPRPKIGSIVSKKEIINKMKNELLLQLQCTNTNTKQGESDEEELLNEEKVEEINNDDIDNSSINEIDENINDMNVTMDNTNLNDKINNNQDSNSNVFESVSNDSNQEREGQETEESKTEEVEIIPQTHIDNDNGSNDGDNKENENENENENKNAIKIYGYNDLIDENKTFCKENGINIKNKEMYLSDSEFESVFGMSKRSFDKLKQWKKVQLKKKVKLF